MTTNEGGPFGHGWDNFYAEVRNTSNSPLAVYDLRNDGWLQSTWLTGDNIDLTPFAGQTVRIAFRAANDSVDFTTFYVDNVELWLCENAPDLGIVKQVVGGPDFSPGDPVTISLSVTNNGAVSAAGVVVSDTLSSDIQSPSWQVSPSLAGTTARGGTTYIWDLPNLASGATGVITINGTINPGLPPEFTIPNLATISTTDPDADLSNNSSRATIGLTYSYLPIILKNSAP
jgi:uncharacterized repeat protein (TIGR01451 family)